MALFIVTGGGGFVGKALVRSLLADGHQVRSLSRGDYPELRELGAETVRADLGGSDLSWKESFSGAAGVFHVAAKVDMWGRYEDFFAANVAATRNVIDAAREHQVPRLVFTSSPSVIANGEDLLGVDETQPYPDRFEAFYPQTKAQAEREVLAANGDALRTCSLRPHLIWGPGDTNLIPTILEKAAAGRLVQVGEGNNLVDLCFIEDCVRAHRLAMDALEENPEAAGRAYFISQGDPVPMWPWINQVLEAHGKPPIAKTVKPKTALFLASLLEGAARFFRFEPPLTKFLVHEMATSHYFNISQAERLLGYKPRYTVAEAMARTFGGGPKRAEVSPSPESAHTA